MLTRWPFEIAGRAHRESDSRAIGASFGDDLEGRGTTSMQAESDPAGQERSGQAAFMCPAEKITSLATIIDWITE
jgi:hypothetical protein